MRLGSFPRPPRGLAFLLTVFIPTILSAGVLLPDFENAPTGWNANRYAPHSFTNVGTYQGMDNVIALEINSAEGINNRPFPYNVDFFNTQGMQYDIVGGPDSSLDLYLYIPSSWSDAKDGNRRTDAWATLPITGLPADDFGYAIAGFTNYGGAARYRVWNNQLGWVDLPETVLYDQWTRINILFTGSALEYRLNGSLVHTDVEPATFDGISALTLMGYNFYDPGIAGAVASDYTAYWAAAAEVPEPGSMALMGLGLGILLAWRQRTQ